MKDSLWLGWDKMRYTHVSLMACLMWEESMELNRKPTPQEEKLLEILIEKSLVPIPDNWREDLLASPMPDGEMGSLHLLPIGVNRKRSFGKQVSDLSFKDTDGIEVIASLNLDCEGMLFELDMWKTDFGKLVTFPDFRYNAPQN